MKLVELYIDGFGILHDYYLGPSDLQAGITVVFGLNEAGKTTLLSFIRAMLFGFRQKGEPVPEALAGGKLGGHLVFEDRRGDRYRVERTGGRRGFRLVLPDGTETGESVLAGRVLQNLSYTVYKNVFAFGMEDLRRLENLSQDQIGSYIYGAGTGVEPGKLTAAGNRLRSEMDGLFTPLGRTVPELNRLAGQITDLETELRELRDLPVRYKNLKDKMAAGRAYREGLRNNDRALRGRIDFLKKLIGAGPIWQELGEAQAALKELPKVDSFPESGVARLNALEEKIHDATVARDGLKEQMDKCKYQLDKLIPDPALLAAADEVRDLAEQRSLLRNLIADTGEASTAARQAREECAAGIDHLGPGWNEERLLGLDLSIVARSQIENHQQTLDDVRAKETALQSEVRRQQDSVRKHKDRRDQARDALDAHRVPAAPVDTPPAMREKMLDRLELDTRQLAALETEQAHLTERKSDVTARLEALARENEALAAPLPGWVLPAALVLLLAVAGIGWTLETLAAVFTLVIGLPVIAAAEYARRRSLAGLSRARQNLAREQRDLEVTLAEIEQALDRVRAQTETVTQAVRDAARAALGVETVAAAEIPAARRQLAEENKARQKRASLAEALAAAGADLDREEESLQATKRELEAVRAARETAAGQWAAWLERAGFDLGLEPTVALAFIDAAERAREMIKNRDARDGAAKSLARRVGELIDRINALAKTLNFPAADTDNAAQTLQAMRAAVEKAGAQALEKRDLGEEHERLKSSIGGYTREIKRWDADVRALLEAAGAADREEFRRRAAVYAERGRLKEIIAARERELNVAAGNSRERERLDQALASGYPEQYAAELQQAEAELESLESEQEELDQEIGRRGEQIAALETGEQLAAALQKREMMHTRFNRKAAEWRVRALALRLLERAKQKYERERQPAVLAWASEYLKPMTADRYRRVIAPVGQADRLEVRRADGVRLGAAQLSRGTAAQLFLAVRLALARQLAETSGMGLPLVLDDILVDFDGQRLEGAVGVLGRVAEAQQVIVFTCHRHIVETMARVCPQSAVIHLQ